MDETEKDYRKAFEDVTTRNVQAAIQYGNDTRKLVREMEAKTDQLIEQMKIQDGIIQELKKQLNSMQVVFYRGGTI